MNYCIIIKQNWHTLQTNTKHTISVTSVASLILSFSLNSWLSAVESNTIHNVLGSKHTTICSAAGTLPEAHSFDYTFSNSNQTLQSIIEIKQQSCQNPTTMSSQTASVSFHSPIERPLWSPTQQTLQCLLGAIATWVGGFKLPTVSLCQYTP